VHPQVQVEQKVKSVRKFLLDRGVGVVNIAVSACVLKMTTKKRSSTFWGKKVHPRENPGYAHASRYINSYHFTSAI